MFSNHLRNIVTAPLRRSLAYGTREKSLNRVTLLGRVGVEPQLRGNDRSPVVLFTLATNSNYTFESGEVQQKTEWHRISVFKPHLRQIIMRSLTKGSRVLVEGRLAYGEVIDSNGTPHVTTSIIAGDVVFLGSANKEEETAEEEHSEAL